MRSSRGLVLAALALSNVACEVREPPITPPKTSYSVFRATVVVNGASETTDIAQVSPDFFEIDGLHPLIGRFLLEPDYRLGAAGVAVLSYEYWNTRFRGDPVAVGAKVFVDGEPTIVIGVAVPRLQPLEPTALWIPRSGPM